MTDENRIQSSWLALMLAAGLVLIFGFGKLYEPGPPYNDPLGGPDAVFEYAQIAVIPLGLALVAGLGGFYRYFAAALGGFGKAGWGLMLLGALAMTTGGILYTPTRNETYWSMLVLGNFVVAFGMLFVGVSAIRGKVLSQGSWSPFVIGITYTAIFVAGNLNPVYEADILTGAVIFLLTGLGWVLFGAALRAGALKIMETRLEQAV